MGYRGLPVRKHSAWDSFRRPRGLDFRVCEIPDFLALKKKVIYIYLPRAPPRDRRCVTRSMTAGIAHGRTARAGAIIRQNG